jgi:type II secretory pathway component GspD/PulD (secretin)
MFNMLTQNSKIKVLSKPQIMTRNNTKAKIIIGKEVPVVKVVDYDNMTDDDKNDVFSRDVERTKNVVVNANDYGAVPELETEYKEVGITLEVTPNISEDNRILLDLKQVVSEVESLSVLNNPVIKKREAATSVVLKNNHTVVIGGLIKRDQIKTKKSVPVLGKIPFFGKLLFTSEENQDVNTELMIFITPIISEDNLDFTQGKEVSIENNTNIKTAQ